MQASRTHSVFPLNLLLWAFVALGAGLLSAVPLSVVEDFTAEPVPAGYSGAPLIAYIAYGREADTLWLADSANPSRKQKRLTIAHAAEFGIVPSLSPDGAAFAYAALPQATLAPAAETPADLWLAQISGEKPRLLAPSIDLLVAPVWSPNNDVLVFRRSDFRLFSMDIASGQERETVNGDGSALFPVAFSPDSALFYYIRIGNEGSDLHAIELATDRRVAHLSDGLTRDWKLSPSGDRLAFLAMDLDSGRTASRAFVLDIASGAASAVGPSGDAFNPTWSLNGDLIMGTPPAAGSSSGALTAWDGSPLFAPPNEGFDVPLGFAPRGDSVVVRNFDGASVAAPGRERLQIIRPDGTRKTISNDEVTFLGWIVP